jgi:hypothetical protein
MTDNNINRIIASEITTILSEGLSQIIYHYTYIPHLVSILKTNRFSTSSTLGGNADAWQNKGRHFFFSTQRTKGSTGYGARHGNVCIILDGRKLNQRHKGHPVDYWNWSKNPKDYDNKSAYKSALLSNELEDRIVTDKPYIENAVDYILEIHVYTHHLSSEAFMDIQNNLNGLPIYYYNDEKQFKLQNKNKSTDPLDINFKSIDPLDAEYHKQRQESKKNGVPFYYTFAPMILLHNQDSEKEDQIYNRLKSHLVELEKADMIDEVWAAIIKKVDELKQPFVYVDDKYRTLTSSIHNDRGNPHPELKFLLTTLIKDMKDWGRNNIKGYVEKKLGMR